MSITFCVLSFGRASSINAIVPAMCGAAMLVPDSVV
jgi:hypothetical protein